MNRSLGRHGIADALRDAGFEVICLHEAFPDELQGDRTPDPDWIKWAAEHDCVIFSKDSRLNRGENLRAIRDTAARVFILPKAHWTEAQQIERFLKHKNRIALAARKPGPCIYRVYNTRPERQQLSDD